MKKKILLVTLTSFATLVTSFAILAATRGVNTANLLTADKIHPGTITIDANDEGEYYQYGINRFKSEAGNEFEFYFDNVTKSEGLFTISTDGRIQNSDIINGITELRFVTPNVDQEITIRCRLNDYTYSWDDTTIDVDGGGINYSFSDYYPGYFMLQNDSGTAFSFSRLTICYECRADVPEVEMTNLSFHGNIDDYFIYGENGVYQEAGTNLADINLDNYNINIDEGGGKGRSINIDSDYVTNLDIKYSESDSTVVLEGENEASVEFDYHGTHYFKNDCVIYGYDHLDYQVRGMYFYGPSEFLVEESDDTIPSEAVLAAYGTLYFYDSSDNSFTSVNTSITDIPLTLGMIVSSDSNRFTGVGEHTMRVSYNGGTYSLSYTIYDPAVNNIRNIYYSGGLELPVGSSSADFLALIGSEYASIQYYEDCKDLDHEIYLTSDNFTLTEGMFDEEGNVNVPVHYSTYIGTISVEVVLSKGNLIKTYTNTDGVSVSGTTVYSLSLYDNDVCEVGFEYYTRLFAYTLSGSVLTIELTEGFKMRFALDDANSSFEKYIRTEGLLKTLKCDFTAFGSPSIYYDAYMYDDNTLILEVDGELDTTYTVDTDDSNTIYFKINNEYMSFDCVGVIDPDTNIMIVDYNVPAPGNLVRTLKVDFSAFGAPPGEYIDADQYDNGVIVVDMYGDDVRVAYTTDPGDSTVIYFNFPRLGACKGVIDTSTNIMVVTADE